MDSQGNSILAGYYQAGALFGDLAVTNAGVSDAFIAKYDSAGSILWVRTVGGTGEEKANSVAVDADDNCYLTGYFQMTRRRRERKLLARKKAFTRGPR